MAAKKAIRTKDDVVLVGVVRRRKDLDLILRERWYRVPLGRLPVRHFDHIAFYATAALGSEGKRIRWHARVRGVEAAVRRELLPDEPRHSRANELYAKLLLGPVRELPRPVMNRRSPRRVTFGFTTLARLRSSRTVLQLFAVPPTEEIMGRALAKAGIAARPQFRIRDGRRRYRLDFAVPCRRGGVAVECDNRKAHGGKRARARDAARDRALGTLGWRVLHFSDLTIRYFMRECVKKVRRAVRAQKGLSRSIH